MKPIEAFKEAARTLPVAERADAEQGANAIRNDLKRHGVDIREAIQREAFLAGAAFVYIGARVGELDLAAAAIGTFFLEEKL